MTKIVGVSTLGLHACILIAGRRSRARRVGSAQPGPVHEEHFRAYQQGSRSNIFPHPEILGISGCGWRQGPDHIDSRVSRLEGVIHLPPLVVDLLGFYECCQNIRLYQAFQVVTKANVDPVPRTLSLWPSHISDDSSPSPSSEPRIPSITSPDT